jgi:menaquinone-dependent protoporphyrinogen oxidase
MNVLVTAASRHGATAGITEAIAAGLARRGVAAEARALDDLAALDGYDAFVLGSAVYMGHWLPAARDFAHANADLLTSRPVWLFSSGPLGPPDHLEPTEEPVDVAGVVELLHPRAHRFLAGKLSKDGLPFKERVIVRAVHAPEGDFRDWVAIDTFASEIADALTPTQSPA